MSARDAERLKAGLDESERDALEMPPERYDIYTGDPDSPETVLSTAKRDWFLRDIAAKRHILALYEEFRAEFDRQWMDLSREDRTPGPGIVTGTQVLGAAVKALAAVYEEAEVAR